MSARDAILGRIRSALNGEPDAPKPCYELWPDGTRRPSTDLFASFVDELKLVQGEAKRFPGVTEAKQFIRELHQSLNSPSTTTLDQTLCQAVCNGLPDLQVLDPKFDRHQLAQIPLAISQADYLIADTGTAVISPRNHAERLLCYLPEIAVFLARPSGLTMHLSDIWEKLAERASDPSSRGEMLLVTGPSRTADIEKKLVLGAHGPKRLIVIVIDNV